MKASQTSPEWPTEHCVDGSRMSFCIPGVWLSVKLARAQAIAYVAVVVYMPWSENDGLGRHEVWAGDDFGDKQQRCTKPIDAEPSHGGIEHIIDCSGILQGKYSYITLFGGESATSTMWMSNGRGMYISELLVYAPPKPLPLLTNTPPSAQDVALRINRRYEAGRPSNKLAEGGVLYHVFDEYAPSALYAACALWQFAPCATHTLELRPFPCAATVKALLWLIHARMSLYMFAPSLLRTPFVITWFQLNLRAPAPSLHQPLSLFRMHIASQQV